MPVFQMTTYSQCWPLSSQTCTSRHISPPHMVVVLPAPLCPRKETTWFSWRLRLSLLRASLLPVLYTLVSLSIHTTSGKWFGSSSMPRISSGVTMRKWEINGVQKIFKYKNRYKETSTFLSLSYFTSCLSALSHLITLWSHTDLYYF